MPDQTCDVKDIFCEAREKTSPEELDAFLDQACGGDAQVRQQVEALLQADRQAGKFLGDAGSEATLSVSTDLGEAPGTVIGRYKLLQQLGHGGFGVVFLAEQQEPYRRVALKIIKPGMDTKEVIARFAAEAQALALMEHPNIARVFDSGATASGRPYFVMELVNGVPITEYCDQNNLTPQERLQLFIAVCRAVQHAHQKGIIHRDLKPNNILVAVQDGTPVVKVIDFGIAKAISQRLTDQTLFTHRGAILGTPLYMSPEQAGVKALDIDTRTDIYSLGVVLYELLAGATPFDRARLSDATPDEVCRIIREEEPPKPSTKIGTLGDTASTVALHRKTEPRRLSSLVKGDLDWIVMKAMEKDRTRRYETAKDLAEDVQRYLDHKPVQASPPSPLYTLRKFLRRNRRAALVTAAAAVMLLLATGAVWQVGAAVKLKHEADRKTERLTQLDSQIIPELEKCRKIENFIQAVDLARSWRGEFPDHPKLAELWHAITVNWTVITNEPGARVSRKPYGVKDAKWEDLGLTPLDRVPVARGFFHWKIEKEGFDAVEGCAGPEEVEIRRDLLPTGQIPAGMVRITAPAADGRREIYDVDRYEATNGEYKEFVDAGGYRRPEFWRVPIVKDGKTIALDEALKTFVDSTGRLGPSTWANGAFPAGEEAFPVRGISWYEAVAYAQFRGKTLPTIEQWTTAASVELVGYIAPQSNMNSDGPVPAGSLGAASEFGVYDAAGNVKEWCVNATSRGRRVVCGGAWDDPIYMFDGKEFVDPLTRSARLGFRCAKETHETVREATIVMEGAGIIEVPPAPSAERLTQYRSVFRYNKGAKFNETVVTDSATTADCLHEVVQLDAVYGNERLTLHLLLPKQLSGPYQTVVYFPGIGTLKLGTFSLDNSDGAYALAIVGTGRAVCYPVYKCTFERRVSSSPQAPEQQAELLLAIVKDLCRALDYLETRPDVFDMSNPVYLGFSWGAAMGPLIMGVEERFSACVLVAGGLSPNNFYPEFEPKTYLRLLQKPVLMINGALDWTRFPLADSQRPLFDAIAAKDKLHHVFPTAGHIVPIDETKALIDAWLSDRFGPVGPPLPPEQRADQLVDRAKALSASKRYPQAEQLLKEALQTYQAQAAQDDPKTLRTAAKLAEAVFNQDRASEARQLLEGTLKRQWSSLGKTHEDTLETRKILAAVYTALAEAKSWAPGKEPEEYREAIRLSQLSIQAHDLRTNQRLFLALAQYRSGDVQASAKTLKDVVMLESGRVNAWLLKAMVHKRLGQDALAGSWFAAATEWLNKDRVTSGGPIQLRAEAAAVLQLPTPWPPADWTNLQWIQHYDRLIQDEPRLPRLYHCRGSHFARVQRWREAIADYGKAAELQPDDWNHREAQVVTCLQADEMDRYKATCQSALANLRPDAAAWLKISISFACSLSSLPDFDRNQLAGLADSAIPPNAPAGVDHWVRLGRGMAAYRQGRLEQALQTLPGDNTKSANPKDALLCLLFRAMTHHRLGDAYTSRRLLQQAREEIQKELAEPDGEELRFQDRPVAWCMVQVALREAESLIQPASGDEARVAQPQEEAQPQERTN